MDAGRGLGKPLPPCYGRSTRGRPKGSEMADEEEPILTHPGTHEMAVHVHDYERFTRLFKWGAIICLIIGLASLIFIKAYW